MTSLGAKSGKLRKSALMRVEHDGDYAVVASLGGAPQNPAWYLNQKANPHVELPDGAAKHDYLARQVDGDEYQLWWDRAIVIWPDYVDYQTRTERKMPIFVLEVPTVVAAAHHRLGVVSGEMKNRRSAIMNGSDGRRSGE